MKHPTFKRKTKIIATIGPATSSRETIRQLIESGMDAARLNFSHGTHADHSTLLQLVREEAQASGRHVAVFQDLCGPKVRIHPVTDGSISLERDSLVRMSFVNASDETTIGSAKELFISVFNPAEVVRRGERALLSDGRVELIAEEIGKTWVNFRVAAGGTVRSRSGLAVPESVLNLPSLTAKDLEDVKWAVANNLDYVALSFVGTAKDVLDLRRELKNLGQEIPIIAKVERAGSLDHIGDIVDVADAVMVARGDLGLELPIERVPSAQRLIIKSANFAGIPVITATQMLMSMVNEVRPTRAEVTDVTTAVRDGTDAVMLSDETAIGKHPVVAIQVLSRILEEAEHEQNYEHSPLMLRSHDRSKVSDAICYAACNAAEKVGAAAMVACTESGYTARLMAKYRPNEVLFGATSNRASLARMALYWGVVPIFVDAAHRETIEDEISHALTAVRDKYGLKPGSRVVITAGLRTKTSGATNVMEIREIPRVAL